MNLDAMRLFALSETRALGASIGAALGIPLTPHEERDFEDGEHKTRPLESVRGCDVFVIQSLYSEPGKSVNDKLCRLLFFIGALKDASARTVTAVLPYLGYARKDRKTKTRDPVTTRYMAQLLEAVGTDRVLTLDVHNLAAFQNAFRCPTDHLEAKKLFVEHFAARITDAELVVVSPDVGGVKRAELFREALSQRLSRPAGSAFMEKQRSAGIVSGEALVGDVNGKTAIIIDDMISTGGTIARTAHACRGRGAQSVHAAASHGLFVGKADQVVADPALDSLVITNTLPPFRLDPELARNRLTVLDVSPLLADAIWHIHNSGSLVELL
ncbi:MAG: ribose-phosphate pyrophosphokinase [Methylobacter sp.]|uniref:ribose-phosphate diphosphokinase n=1 Tax=Methylobacter sp. TaxID=2051955 RepID=UPI00258B2754|nr:ribose-phosphate pyrophosphokinase [Methylobacter sp.]MCL7422460.1 ribose-phosphate pyrophosphokinase [Methylobacter sp.]